jgi:flavodoxin
MRTLVTYASLTGNTRKIAKAIYDGISDEKKFFSINECQSTDEFDLVFVGFPVYNFEPFRPAAEFIKKIKPGTAVALFMTMSLTAAPDSPEKQQLYDLTIGNCKSIAMHTQLIDIFDCPGELAAETAEALLKSNDPALQGFGRMRPFTIGYPKPDNIIAAERFGKEIFKKVTTQKISQEYIM